MNVSRSVLYCSGGARRVAPLARVTVLLTVLLAGLAACVSTTGSGAGPRPTSSGTPPRANAGWSTATRQHVDLWFHGFAMLTSDTAQIPYFERDYRRRMLDLKRQRGLTTMLDANRERLSARLATTPALANAQFIALYFGSLAEIVRATDFLVRTQGDPRAVTDPTLRLELAVLAANFPTAADRDWARIFVQSLQDENTRFYQAYWNMEQQNRAAARADFEARWQSDYYPKFRRFLNNTQQPVGELLLSLPLDGEGRTVSDDKRSNEVAVAFPRELGASVEPAYVFAHEVVAALAQSAITDNTTPADLRAGVVSRYTANAPVRGGAMLLQRVAPALLTGYMTYYLRSAGRPVPAGDPATAFNATFPIPDVIRDAIDRQIGVVLGGI
jgi:hypothetical protein